MSGIPNSQSPRFVSVHENGGPAFPVVYGNEADGSPIQPAVGMTLRDYFAAKAMQAFIAAPCEEWPEPVHRMGVSEAAFAQADAMLKARQSCQP